MTGERCLVRFLASVYWLAFIPLAETMTEHRVRTLSTLLPIALATGYSEAEPNFEPLKVLPLHIP